MLFEILLFLRIDVFTHIFGKMASKNIQDGVRLQKSIERKILLQTIKFSQCLRLVHSSFEKTEK
jgi:hypothetical protein